jgi:plastocyanin
MRFAAGVVPLVLALAACAAPLSGGDPVAQGTLPVTGQRGQISQVRPTAPTETVTRPIAVQTPTASLGDPIVTPLPPTVTPIAPPFPTLTLGPRAQLDPGSQAALTGIQATFAALTASGTATAAALPPREILMQGIAFSPAQISVPPGTTVIWRNLDRVQHQVRGGEFDSGRINTGSYWAAILGKPGLYQFLCSFHPNMRAEITVTADDSRPVQLGS